MNELPLEALVVSVYALLLSAAAVAIEGVSRLHRGIAVGLVGSALLTISATAFFFHEPADIALFAAASAVALSVGAHAIASPAARLDP